jgi:poly-gamma-glutamate synthesis protein (capsule biosynthesis protein)
MLVTVSSGILIISACTAPVVTQPIITSTPFLPIETSTSTPVSETVTLFLSDQLPGDWQELLEPLAGVSLVDSESDPDLWFIPSTGKPDEHILASFDRVYAAAVPFFTVEDEISFNTLSMLWQGGSESDELREIIVSTKTRNLFASVWGEPGKNVLAEKSSELLDMVKASPSAIAIIPFEEITPRWKILKVDGRSPLDKPFEQEKYPLRVSFNLVADGDVTENVTQVVEAISAILPTSNRDESKMTVVVMSGTTAITRGLAYKITINDAEYPIALVKDWFLSADLRHVSNESPFYEDCPSPDPYTSSLVFCTSPDMIEVLEKIGINVVELTGNHIKDYLEENLLYSIQMYKDRGWYYYAAGENAQQAREPVLIEHNGNRIAFIGCNAVGPASVWANDQRAGAAQCDYEYLTETIKALKVDGYTVITTFQHAELSQQEGWPVVLMFAEKISGEFRSAAEAGADIVQGSQAHYPMGFEFVGDSLIHYGLGNFLFDQMWDPNRNEFIDRHIIYDGKYVNTELLTAVLMDWSQPTPMDHDQRVQFLDEIFTASKAREE